MAITGFNGFNAAAAAAAQLRSRYNEETRIAASGQKADTYAGLGTEAGKAIDLSNELTRRNQLSNIAARGEARAAYGQVVLTRLSDIAGKMTSQAGQLSGSGGSSVKMIADSARAALQEVAGLLNERYQGEAVFGGSDLEGDPIAGPDQITQSGLFQQIGTAMQGLAAGNAASVLESVRGLARSNDPAVSPFSDYANAAAAGTAEDSRRAVPGENGTSVSIGLYANRNAAIGETGNTTGSWSRDLIMGLSMLANMTEAQVGQGADFTKVLQGAMGALRDASNGLGDESGALGLAQERLESSAIWHQDVASQVELQLGDVTMVDPAEAYLRLSATKTQMEASYKALSMLGSVSLTNYL